MRRYETILIIDPDLSDDKRSSILEKLRDLITQHKAFLVEFDDWGVRKLAYEIKKKGRGYYLRVDYCGISALVNEIERFARIEDQILKYMTVLLDENADIEKIKEELASIEAEKKKAEQSESSNSDKPETSKPETSKKDESPALQPKAVQQPSEPPESAAVEEDATKTKSKEEE
ncbi:MAG: 30S ribosomal protein S6 [Deltaproteobacteria bacterium]|nr:30S ribosomal protein S6 [Deltaproteobacteria bacterium]MBW2662961.1 30S ribosomal protein S6 [Deltaproteobacteria bacterium]